MGLATKITLPFVALFAVILLALGVLLAREIFQEVETRVESEQRFLLDFATYTGFAVGEESLREIRDRAANSMPGKPAQRGEFVVLQDEGSPISTFRRDDPNARRTIEALEQAVHNKPSLNQRDDSIQRDVAELNGQTWLVLHTFRATRGPAPLRRHFYLLYPYSEMEQAKNRALTRMVTLGAFGLVLASVLGLLIGHWIASPIRRLAAAAKRLSAGGLGEQLDPALLRSVPQAHGADEIGELTRSFQHMVESLRSAQTEIVKAERLAATGKLAACVAHEIRNPLTSLRMTVQMLEQRADPNDENTREAYPIVLGEIDRLALAVEELLTFARPHPVRRVPTDVNKLAADTLKFLARQLAHARVLGVLALEPAMPPEITVDPHKIRQLLVNLILNALQAVVRDGEIEIRTEWDAARGHVIFSIRDTGPGIAEEVRERLFELFVSTKPGGGGLGLVIAKQVAEEHGGNITFETSPKGTTFRVVIPKQ